MVAYSFKARFVDPILWGIKDQTIRLQRRGSARHAQPGDALQAYVGMRTKACRLILRSACTETLDVRLRWSHRPEVIVAGEKLPLDLLDPFSVRDGFTDFDDMARFWRDTHPGIRIFDGVMPRWRAPRAPVEMGATVET